MPGILDNIRAKYPQYKDVNDSTLAAGILKKYPVYKSQLEQYLQPQKQEPAPGSTQFTENIKRPYSLLAENLFGKKFADNPIVAGVTGTLDLPTKIIAGGAQAMEEARQRSAEAFNKGDVAGGTLQAAVGAVTPFMTAFQLTPAGQAITAGIEAIAQSSPTAAKGVEIAMSPSQSLLQPKTPVGQAAATLADIVWQGLVFKFGHDAASRVMERVTPIIHAQAVASKMGGDLSPEAKVVEQKAMNNEPLTPPEQEISRALITTPEKFIVNDKGQAFTQKDFDEFNRKQQEESVQTGKSKLRLNDVNQRLSQLAEEAKAGKKPKDLPKLQNERDNLETQIMKSDPSFIPDFQNSGEATDFARRHPDLIPQLEMKQRQLRGQFDNLARSDFKGAIEAHQKAHLVDEALDVARNPNRPEPVEKLKAKDLSQMTEPELMEARSLVEKIGTKKIREPKLKEIDEALQNLRKAPQEARGEANVAGADTKTAEEHLITAPRSELPTDISQKLVDVAQGMKGELESASRVQQGSYGVTENLGKGWEHRTVVGRPLTVSSFPQWFTDLGANKEAVLRQVQKVLDDEGKDKVPDTPEGRKSLLAKVKAVMVEHLSKGRIYEGGKVQRGSEIISQGAIQEPPDEDIAGLIDLLGNKKVTPKELTDAFNEYKAKQTEFPFGANAGEPVTGKLTEPPTSVTGAGEATPAAQPPLEQFPPPVQDLPVDRVQNLDQLNAELVPGLNRFWTDDVVRIAKSIPRGIKELWQMGRSAKNNLFTPEAVSEAAGKSDAVVAKYIRKEAQLKMALRDQYRNQFKFWELQPEERRLAAMDAMEGGPATGFGKFQGKINELLTQYRSRFDQDFLREKDAGIEIGYRESYFPHLWKDPEKADAFFRNYAKSLGKDRYAKMRDIDLIKTGLDNGLALKSTNLEELALMRDFDSVRLSMRQQMIDELERLGLAERVGFTEAERAFSEEVAPLNAEEIRLRSELQGQQGLLATGQAAIEERLRRIDLERQAISEKYKGLRREHVPKVSDLIRGKMVIDSPNGNRYAVGQDIARVLNNSIFSKSLWTDRGLKGAGFRGLMYMKNLLMPVKLGLSLFHPVHVTGIDIAARTSAYLYAAKEGAIGYDEAVKEAVKSLVHPFVPRAKDFLQAEKRYGVDPTLPDYLKQAVQYEIEGGFTARRDFGWTTSAKEQFMKAYREGNYPGAVVRGIPAIFQAMQVPIFDEWIPRLRAAQYHLRVELALKEDPTLLDDPVKRGMRFREIAKEVDNQYGEMNLDTLFWNRYLRDIGTGTSLSLGWNLGFIREFVAGGAVDIAKLGGQLLQGKFDKSLITDKMLFTTLYTAQAMGFCGLATWAFTGKLPTTMLDYFYPRTGQKNLDGTDERLGTPYYTREYFMAAEHVAKEGLVGGLTQLAVSKMNPVISPLLEAWQNRDFYGYEINDPNGGYINRAYQIAKFLGTQYLPISIGAGIEARGSGISRITSFAGFSPAAKYVTRTRAQEDIMNLYERRYGGGTRPYSARAGATAKRDALRAIKEGNQEKANQILGEALTNGSLTRKQVKALWAGGKEPTDVWMYKRLPESDKEALYRSFSEEEKKRYPAPGAHPLKRAAMRRQTARY